MVRSAKDRKVLFTAVTLLFALLLAAATAIVGSYSWFKAASVAEVARRNLPAYTANAVKHAYAAAQTYSLLRSFFVEKGVAAQVVYRLGQLNEYAEYYGRRGEKRDPTREIYKDLYNNLAGVAAASILERHAPPLSDSTRRLALIGQWTADGTIMATFLDPRVPDFGEGSDPRFSDLAQALEAFKRDRAAMNRRLLGI